MIEKYFNYVELINITIGTNAKLDTGVRATGGLTAILRHVYTIELNNKITSKHNIILSSLNDKKENKSTTIKNYNDISRAINQNYRTLIEKIDAYIANGSGYVVGAINHLDVDISEYSPLGIGKYIELNKTLQNRLATINIKNEDNRCFIYCVLYHIYKSQLKENANRVSKYDFF